MILEDHDFVYLTHNDCRIDFVVVGREKGNNHLLLMLPTHRNTEEA